MKLLAERYKDGAGVDQSWEQATHFYKMAVEHGDVSSMVDLGFIYDNGHGVEQEQDLEKSKELYMQAAALGNMGAIINLKTDYINEQKAIAQAKESLMQAAALNNMGAIINQAMESDEVRKATKATASLFTVFFTAPTFCTYCGKAHSPPTTKLSKCRGCLSAFYCCKEHQIIDWRLKKNGHKLHCLRLKELNLILEKYKS